MGGTQTLNTEVVSINEEEDPDKDTKELVNELNQIIVKSKRSRFNAIQPKEFEIGSPFITYN